MLEPGTLVAGYRVDRVLGSGGMGAVFLARHPELPRYDALKVLKASAGLTDSNFRRRFLREAEVAATLDHPNIVTVFNRGRASVPIPSRSDASTSSSSNPVASNPVASERGEADLLWIAMQYVPGTDCARELAGRGRFAPRRVVHIVSEVARGIDHANRRGLLHRDVKPANILLAEVDEDSSFDEQRVLLTDFGVAKLSDETEALTSVGTVLATLSYASPEQLTGRRLDGRTDQYSLAATAFHLLTGRVPFDDRDNGAVIGAHLKEPVPRVSDLVPGLPAEADSVIARAMAKTPDDRFASCREFADALARSLRSVRPRSVADLDAETIRGIPGQVAGRAAPGPRPAPEMPVRPGRPTPPPAGRPPAGDRAPTERRPPRPGRPANPDPAHQATQRATPARATPPGRPSDRGAARSDRAVQPGPGSRPTTGADPAVWQHPPSNPFRQSNDHLRPDGTPPAQPGAPRGPGLAAQPGALRGPVPRGPAGPVGSPGSGRPAANRLPVALAIIAVVLLIAIVVVFLAL
ncbi:serine/threonine-protein kinase [Gordonia sp. KTR9]|uniref:serine/threonine-protein kinase n=1 Tax=Gordonia sp. KTR9 TaxID=337191 RepID=UPI00027DE241|nr:serine/threonine-protein kinase [Gordonia sp. KTR9]AFR49623.1 Serine/threonine protein kinase [Gordonia sp. KTR9]